MTDTDMVVEGSRFSRDDAEAVDDAQATKSLPGKIVVPMEITFMDTEDKYKKYGTLRSLRYIYSNPFQFPISSLGLTNFPSQKS